MADVRYFRVEQDTSLPRAFRAVRDNSGTVYDYETEGVAYDAGSYVSSDNIDPRVLERLDDGDEHLNSLLTEVDKSEVEESDQQARVDNELVRSPEHSSEAYVLASDPEQPYTLLPSSEAVVEVNEEQAEASKKQLEDADAVVDSVDAEETPSAIDFAILKGDADKEAGKAQSVTDLAQEGVFAEEVSTPDEPSEPSEPTPEPEPAPEPTPEPEPAPEEPAPAQKSRKKSTANATEVKKSDKDS